MRNGYIKVASTVGVFWLGIGGVCCGQSLDRVINEAARQIERSASEATRITAVTAVPVNQAAATITVPPKRESLCGQAPTQVTQFSTTQFVLDKSTAAKLGLTFALSGNAAYDAKSKVFVREVKRYSSCDSTDGRFTLQYGATWRATVLIDEMSASGAVNFAVAAASATLNNAAVQVAIEARGWADNDIPQLSAAAMQATAAGLNVVTFSKFNEAAEQAAAKAIVGKLSDALELIAIMPKQTDYTSSVITALALQYISEGRGCLDAVRDIGIKGPEVESVIRDVYNSIAGGCGVQNDEAKRKALGMLNGVHVSAR